MMNSPPLAIFDLDGTLVDRDTLLPFLVGYGRQTRRAWPLVRLPFDLGLYAAGLVRERAAKQGLLRLFCGGHELERIDEFARSFFSRWLPRRWRPSIVGRLEDHRRSGHRIILVTASPDLYVPRIAESLNITEVVCTRVSRDGARCGGEIIGDNCKGEVKVRMLREHLGGQPIPPGSSAYGDSASDRPLLQAVEHGYLCDRKGRLTAIGGR